MCRLTRTRTPTLTRTLTRTRTLALTRTVARNLTLTLSRCGAALRRKGKAVVVWPSLATTLPAFATGPGRGLLTLQP